MLGSCSTLRVRARGDLSLTGPALLLAGLAFSSLLFFDATRFVSVFLPSVLLALAINHSIWTIGSLVPICVTDTRKSGRPSCQFDPSS
jgi:hypothetical protein